MENAVVAELLSIEGDKVVTVQLWYVIVGTMVI